MIRMRPYFIITALLLTVFMSSFASATQIASFNMIMPDGTIINNVGNLDFAPGSGLSVNGNFLGPGGAGSPIQLLYQAFTAAIQGPAFNDLTPPLLRAPFASGGYEFTVVTRVWETPSGLGTPAALFTLANDPTGTQPNVIEIWADSTTLGGSPASVFAGIGFRDGVLALRAVPISLSGVFTISDTNTNGVIDNQDTGAGSTDIVAKVTYVNSTFFDFSTFPVGSIIKTHFIGTINTPPEGVNTVMMWNGIIPNYFGMPAAIGGPGTPQTTNDIMLKVDGTSHFNPASCCIDIEKEISVDGGTTWHDADTVETAPIVGAPHDAKYRLIAKNSCTSPLANVTITDTTLGINYTVGNLAPGQEITLTENDIPQLNQPNRCESAGEFENTASITGDCTDLADESVTDSDDAWLVCKTCDVDIEKYVRQITSPLPDWADADQCNDDDVPHIQVPGGAEYKLVVQNTGLSTLTNCTITDSQLGINYNVGADLAPGEILTLTGTQIPELVKPNRCEAAGVLPNTASITCDCADVAGIEVSDSDSACVNCFKETGGCRMTGGHNTVTSDGTYYTVPGGAEFTRVATSGKKTTTFKYTVGGQIGAPEAGCLSGPDPKQPYGNWEHAHHENGVLKFSFHAGTTSSPPDAYIQCITCTDPGWCVQARCAPFKQIFWEGTGVFQNPNPKSDSPFKLNGCTIDPKAGKTHSLHFYQAHVGDFGEPGNTGKQKSWDPDVCHWESGGVDWENTHLMTPLPPVPHPKFAGGQVCDACPDWYEIEVHCTSDPNSTIIYRAAGYLTGGNHQIHPPVSEQCTF